MFGLKLFTVWPALRGHGLHLRKHLTFGKMAFSKQTFVLVIFSGCATETGDDDDCK